MALTMQSLREKLMRQDEARRKAEDESHRLKFPPEHEHLAKLSQQFRDVHYKAQKSDEAADLLQLLIEQPALRAEIEKMGADERAAALKALVEVRRRMREAAEKVPGTFPDAVVDVTEVLLREARYFLLEQVP